MGYFKETAHMDQVAAALVKQGKVEDAVAQLTAYSKTTGDAIVKEWLSLWQSLFFRFRDGFTVTRPTASAARVGGKTNYPLPNAKEVGYSKSWYTRIVKE